MIPAFSALQVSSAIQHGQLHVVLHTCSNHSIQGAEAERWLFKASLCNVEFWGKPGLHNTLLQSKNIANQK